jgi:hypothetical protein
MANFIGSMADNADKGFALAKSETVNTIYDAVYYRLVKTVGLPPITAAKYANFATELYTYIKEHPALQMSVDVYDFKQGANAYKAALIQVKRFKTTGNEVAELRYARTSAEGAGGAISALLDYFGGWCRANGVAIDECSLEITKVIIDVLTAFAMIDAVVTAWAGFIQLIASTDDSLDAYKACFSSGKAKP